MKFEDDKKGIESRTPLLTRFKKTCSPPIDCLRQEFPDVHFNSKNQQHVIERQGKLTTSKITGRTTPTLSGI